MKRKIYYFTCLECHRHTPKDRESFLKVNVCQRCYEARA